MINKNLNLNTKIFDNNIEKVPTRNGWGEGLIEAGKLDDDVVVLSADLAESTRSEYFKKEFPERFIEVGVAEQALATVASGMANYGKIPFISSYAAFSPGRNWEQIRTTIALNDVPVKIGGAHAGLTVGPDGATHQMLEDIALMRTMPNMQVLVPCDAFETKRAVIAAAKNEKPTYIRFAREATANMTTDKTPFEIGKMQNFWEVREPMATIIASGPILFEAIVAAKYLSESGIEVNVCNLSTIKPIDEPAIINAARLTGAIVTVEEHQVAGGAGSAVSEVLVKNHHVPIEMVGVEDSFGESGKPEELIAKFGLTHKHIIEKIRKVLQRKNF